MGSRQTLNARYIAIISVIVILFLVLTRNIRTAFSIIILFDLFIALMLVVTGLKTGDRALVVVGCICGIAGLGAVKPYDEIGIREVLVPFLGGAVGVSAILYKSSKNIFRQ